MHSKSQYCVDGGNNIEHVNCQYTVKPVLSHYSALAKEKWPDKTW